MIAFALGWAPYIVLVAAYLSLSIVSRSMSIPDSKNFITILSILWIFVVQGDSILLGPFSRLEWGDGEFMFLGYFPYLADNRDALFLHELMGGVDRYSLGRIGGAIYSGRLWMSEVMPLWLVVVLMRILVTSVALWSVYLFARKRFHTPRLAAFGFGALFSAGFDVTTSLTFLYGVSIAAIPLVLLALCRLEFKARPIIIFFLVALFYILFADPFFWLIGLWISAISLAVWHRPNNVVLYFLGLVLMSILWVANFAEAIVGMVQMVPQSSRPDAPSVAMFGDFAGYLKFQLQWMFNFRMTYNAGSWPYFVPLIYTFVQATRFKNRQIFIAGSMSLIMGIITPFLVAVPWGEIGLDFLTSYRWYVEYCAFAMVMLSAAAAACLRMDVRTDNGHLPAAICISVALAMVFVFKVNTVLHMKTRGNLSRLEQISNLQNPDWFENRNARVVGIPTGYDPNSSVSYGLSSFDGISTIVPKSTYEFWRELILETDMPAHAYNPGLPFRAEFNTCCEAYDISRDLNLDMLRVANVGYILSFKQLETNGLAKISGPQVQQPISAIGKAPDIFVYELPNPFPRAYPATSVTSFAADSNFDEFVDHIRENAPLGDAAIRTTMPDDAIAPNSIDAGSLATALIPDGFQIDIPVATGGAIIVNAPPLPWWSVTASGGQSLEWAAANLGQVVVFVPKGVESFEMLYQRPTLY